MRLRRLLVPATPGRRALAEQAAPLLGDACAAPGAPRSLREPGLTETDLAEVIAQARAQPYANPRPITEQARRALLTDALEGSLAP